MTFVEALSQLRPGFAFTEAIGDDYTEVIVAGERGNEVLLKGGEAPGWWARADIAEALVGGGAREALCQRLKCRRLAARAATGGTP